MKKFSFNRLSSWAMFIAVVWSLAQFVLIIVYSDLPLGWDAKLVYDAQAQLSAKLGMPYPTPQNVNDIYLQGAGYVNLLALLYALFGTYKPVLLLNAIMNIGILCEVYYLAKRFFSKRTASISVILFCLITTNFFAAIHVATEVPYLFFALSAFCLSLHKKLPYILLAGVLYAYAHTIRAIELAFLVPSIVYYVFKKVSYKNYITLLTPFLVILISYGCYVKQQTGYFYTSSSITGFDLMFTAYDEADGGQDMSIWSQPNGVSYIENDANIHFAIKDSIRTERAIIWIKQHPSKYIYLCFKRIPLMFRNDSWSVPKFSAYDDIREIKKMADPQKGHYILYFFQTIYSSLFYITGILFLISIIHYRKELVSEKGILLLIFVLGVAGTCLIGMQARYHYPYVFIMILFASYRLSNVAKGKSRHKDST